MCPIETAIRPRTGPVKFEALTSSGSRQAISPSRCRAILFYAETSPLRVRVFAQFESGPIKSSREVAWLS
jgi:hypothetical protein